MKYINQKNKLKKISNQNTSNLSELNNQNIVNTENNNIFNQQLKSPEQYYKKAYNNTTFFSLDWVEMEYGKSPAGDLQLPYRLFKNWTIEFAKFDYRLLGHIKVEPLIKFNSGTIDDNPDDVVFYKTHFFTLSDLPNETYYKRVVLTASLSFTFYDVTHIPFQREVKLLLQYINPIKVI